MTTEERQNERQENEALKSAKEIAKKKSKDKIQKVIWKAAKAAIIPILILAAKIILVSVIITLAISLMTITITGSGGDSKAEILNTEDAIYFETNYSIFAGSEDSIPVLNKLELAQAIDRKFTGQAKENYLSVLDDLVYIQEQYGVNAVFAIAVAQAESSGGTNWGAIAPETYNWMSVTGSYNGQSYHNPESSNYRTWRVYDSFGTATRDFGDLIANGGYYFNDERYDIIAIAERYCPPGISWSNSVMSIMGDIYNQLGIDIEEYNTL